jgi:hypothetical protein
LREGASLQTARIISLGKLFEGMCLMIDHEIQIKSTKTLFGIARALFWPKKWRGKTPPCHLIPSILSIVSKTPQKYFQKT